MTNDMGQDPNPLHVLWIIPIVLLAVACVAGILIFAYWVVLGIAVIVQGLATLFV